MIPKTSEGFSALLLCVGFMWALVAVSHAATPAGHTTGLRVTGCIAVLVMALAWMVKP